MARYADVERVMQPNGKYAPLVQQLLDTIQPWKKDEDPIETMEFNEAILPMAVPTNGTRPIWGVHVGHKAMRPGLSPFVEASVPSALLGAITVELSGPMNDVILTRAYGGEYTPPLPWMTSAREAHRGRRECREYWQTHAYLLRNPSLIRTRTRTTIAPEWFHS